MKKILSLILTCALLVSLCACTKSRVSESNPLGLIEQGKLLVSTCADFEPMEYYEAETIKGFDADLASYIAGQIGAELVFINYDSIEDAMTALENDEVDMSVAAYEWNNERAERFLYSEYYYPEIGDERANDVILFNLMQEELLAKVNEILAKAYEDDLYRTWSEKYEEKTEK